MRKHLRCNLSERRSEERIAVKLGRNETLQGLLNRFGLRPGSAQELAQKIYSSVDLRRMPRDQAISLVVDRQDGNIRVVEFVMQEHLVRASFGLLGWSVERQELAHVAGLNTVRVRITESFAAKRGAGWYFGGADRRIAAGI